MTLTKLLGMSLAVVATFVLAFPLGGIDAL